MYVHVYNYVQDNQSHFHVFVHVGTKVIAYHDTCHLPSPTIRHSDCALMLPRGDDDRCEKCSRYRHTLTAMLTREQSRSGGITTSSSHANYCYLSTPENVDRLHCLHHDGRSQQRRIQRLRSRIADMTASRDLSLDTETTTDIQSIIVEEESRALRGLPQDSFQRIFWQQQKAAAMVDKRGMRWHPAMIKWYLFLRHQSSKAYETLRKSGCIQLPSQRTLRDYSHGVESDVGFSAGVDHQLMQTVGMPACQDWEKLVILLLDEIYIREDLVFDKHSGRLIGYASLGDVNDHLLAFEHAVEAGAEKDVIAKTMMVFMVRGLFSPLRFAYAQFPCATVTGDLLYHPFWQAVFRLERMGLKVCNCGLQ